MEKNTSKFNEEFMKMHSYLSFLPERMKINKFRKLVCNLNDKKNKKHKKLKASIKSWINF